MIQRIQTLYLAAVFLMTGSLQFLQFSNADSLVFTAKSITFNDEIITTPVGVMILAGLGALLALVAIFKFKDRKQQMLLCKINMLVQALLIAAIFMYFDAAINEAGIESEANYGIGTFLPLISLILCFLADKAIKKDDDLVKSVDRIR